MCGIIHCKTKSGVAKNMVLKRFQKQKARGTQGFGFVEIEKGSIISEVRTQTEAEILQKLNTSTADEIMFHHRFPTSTPNVIESTHPIKVTNSNLIYNYYVIHNGIIMNDTDLRTKHLKSGFQYNTEIKKQWITKQNIYEKTIWNDSEALAIDFALAIENDTDLEANGSIAIIALQFEKETGKAVALYYGRNEGNPLKVENDRNFFALSSEIGKDIKANVLHRFDYDTSIVTSEKKNIGIYHNYVSNSVASQYANYGADMDDEDDFEMMEYDILDQIDELNKELRLAQQESDFDSVEEIEYQIGLLQRDLKELKRFASNKMGFC